MAGMKIVLHSSLIDDLEKMGDSVKAAQITTAALNMIMKNMDEEFHVDTPKKDGGKKKQAKYGWMKDKNGIPYYLTSDGKKHKAKPKPSARVIDAIFIAPSVSEAIWYAKALNYKPVNCILVTGSNFERKLNGMQPDEDIPVHLCGSWLAEDVDVNTYYDLDDVIHYLRQRSFDYVEVPEIGKANP